MRRHLEAVLSKALTKERNEKYQSAREFADDIQRLLDGVQLKARPTNIWTSVRQWVTREERIRQAGLTGVTVMIGLCTFNFLSAVIAIAGEFGLGQRWSVNVGVFVFHMAVGNVVLALMGWITWKAGQGRLPFIWLATIQTFGLFLLTLAGRTVFPYQAGERWPNLETRNILYFFFWSLSMICFAVCLFALLTAYRLSQLDRLPAMEESL